MSIVTSERLPVPSLEEQEQIHRKIYLARGRLERVLDHLSIERGGAAHVRAESNVSVHDLVIAYALETYDIEWEAYSKQSRNSEKIREWARELANRRFSETCPPRLPGCLVSLAGLAGNDSFRSRLAQALQSRVEALGGTRGTKTAVREIIKRYAEEHCLTQKEIAERALIDASVLRAVMRGEKKCSDETLEGLAQMLHCTSEDLKPPGGWREAKREQKRG
jgi:predicted XRE-type DNA-binding protein